MTQVSDPVTITVSRSVLSHIAELSSELTDQMHALLEKNTDGQLTPTERAELERLVEIAEFGQIITMALGRQGQP